eukprot:15462010-Alexandrium_andersonii.AAC.1
MAGGGRVGSGLPHTHPSRVVYEYPNIVHCLASPLHALSRRDSVERMWDVAMHPVLFCFVGQGPGTI